MVGYRSIKAQQYTILDRPERGLSSEPIMRDNHMSELIIKRPLTPSGTGETCPKVTLVRGRDVKPSGIIERLTLGVFHALTVTKRATGSLPFHRREATVNNGPPMCSTMTSHCKPTGFLRPVCALLLPHRCANENAPCVGSLLLAFVLR